MSLIKAAYFDNEHKGHAREGALAGLGANILTRTLLPASREGLRQIWRSSPATAVASLAIGAGIDVAAGAGIGALIRTKKKSNE